MTEFRFTLLGQPYSKANRRRAVKMGDKMRFIKSKEGLGYEKSAIQQLKLLCMTRKIPREPLGGDVTVTMEIFYTNRRPDLDESLILDVLEGFCYLNDRQVKAKHIFHHLDKECPRAEIHVEAIEED